MIYADRQVIYDRRFTLSNRAYQKGKYYYYSDIITLDTETSSNIVFNKDGSIDKDNTNSWIYQWCICTKDYLINGDNIDSLIAAICKIDSMSQYGIRKIYVHNLGYDNTYMIQSLVDKLGIPEIVALDKHKEICINFEHIQLCCSYRLSNKSLDKWSNDLNTEHKKKIGYIEYTEKHYPGEKRSEKDNIYMWHDVLSQYECIEKQLYMYTDTLASIPLTSTGYIRRLVRKSYHDYNLVSNDKGFKDFLKMRIDSNIYNMLRMEFQGGLTHGNRFYANRIVNISKKLPYGKHRDFDSHYPTQQLTKKYPMGKWVHEYSRTECKKRYSIKEVDKLIKADKAILMMCSIKGLKLRDPKESLPYAQECKFRQNSKLYGVFDNGRVLEYSGESIVSLNEIDYQILKKQYTFKIEILDLYYCDKDYLPSWLTDVIKDLYKRKNELKKRVQEIEESLKALEGKYTYDDLYDAKLDLLKVKELLNAIYGMSATNPVRDLFIIDDQGEYKIEHLNINEALDKYYKSRNNCLQYAWGCWCTSYARMELIRKKDIIEDHGGIFLYADTDSIFYLSNDEVEAVLDKDDQDKLQLAIDNNYCVTLNNGKVKYFDHFDSETDYKAFKFLHAKCYGTIDINDHLDITVAGVRKRECIGLDSNDDPIFITREEELKTLDKLAKGTKFKECGGTQITYINKPMEWRVIDGHKIKCGNCAIINKVEKTLSEFTLKEIIDNVRVTKNRVYL